MNSILNKKNTWIGLAKVSKLGEQDLDGFNQGYATTRNNFRKLAKIKLHEMDWDLRRLEEVELFNLRVRKFEIKSNGFKGGRELSFCIWQFLRLPHWNIDPYVN